jgi:proline dehydrogenase
VLRRVLLSASRNQRVRRLVETAPVTKDVVRRFVAGETTEDAVRVARELRAAGLLSSLDHLGEHVNDVSHAKLVSAAYLEVLRALDLAGLTAHAEVSLKLSAVGQDLDASLCLDLAREICAAATDVGTTVTLDMEDHTTTDATLATLAELRQDFPSTGAVIQSYLRRSRGDIEDLIRSGARVRLCKGAYKEPESVAYQRRGEVDLSYVRLLVRLLRDGAYPMIATHDPRLVAIAEDVARRTKRAADSYEFQMLYGVRPVEQRRLAEAGHRVRVYTPYGTHWYAYFMRRLAERPANVAFFLRQVVTKT